MNEERLLNIETKIAFQEDMLDEPKILSWLDENPLMLRQAQHERIF